MNHSVLRKAAILGLAVFTLAGTFSPAVNAQVSLETSVDNEGTPIQGGSHFLVPSALSWLTNRLT